MTILLTQDGEIANESSDYMKKLEFVRRRDLNTGRERLAVNLYDKDSDTKYATIYCDCFDLQQELLQLRLYGILLTRGKSNHIKKEIENEFYNIALETDEFTPTVDNDIGGIIKTVCQYVLDSKIEARDVSGDLLYNVPVHEFNEIIKRSEYKRYRQIEIRRKLKDLDYTVCSIGRYDNTITVGNDGGMKVISLRADDSAIEQAIQEIRDKNQNNQNNQNPLQ